MAQGFLIIDKPAGISSHGVVNRVRRILGVKRVGHTGTLDPFATGVLPIAVGEATKAIPFLDEGIKEYTAEILFGTVTDTLDITGTVLSKTADVSLNRSYLLAQMKTLTGTISQIPPMFSAIKQGGQPLYKLARKGVAVERKSREVTIFSFELLDLQQQIATVQVCCSRGTYIRSLADDLGKAAGCGACLTSLKRTRSGSFLLQDAITLENLEATAGAGQATEIFLDTSKALGHLPEIVLDDQQSAMVSNGRLPVFADHKEPSRLTFMGRLLAVTGFNQDNALVLKRVFNQNIT